MELFEIQAFSDNYIWVWHDQGQAVVVDPGESEGVMQALSQRGLTLAAILVTHHHPDHVGGVAALQAHTGAQVYGPARENLPFGFTPVMDGEPLHLLGQRVDVIDVPGHTAGHVAYFVPAATPTPVLFCGDALFSAGCGRIFEGTPAQMLASLDRLGALPAATRVCCAHEYTLANLRFALAVEALNPELQTYATHCQQLRDRGLPTLPATLGTELRINPFLRSRHPAVQHAVAQHANLDAAQASDEVAVFAALREWKNDFK